MPKHSAIKKPPVTVSLRHKEFSNAPQYEALRLLYDQIILYDIHIHFAVCEKYQVKPAAID